MPVDHTEQHPRRVLLAVTGLSPQIVTETLYALAVERKWIPTEIRIITTRQGEEKARLTLLSDNPGWFRRLREDYGLPEIRFTAEHIHVITGPDGQPLDDILQDADNVAVADFITEQVREITADPATSLHVSIAGGRKTMGFYVGYALSLLGRAQDRLSHVLVAPPLFESVPEFFYPAPRTRVIQHGEKVLDASAGRVHLGNIPFVRLRDGLPKSLLEGRATFSAAVAEAQRALPPLALGLEPASRAVSAGGERFNLPPQQFALYWMLAERCKAAAGGVHWSDPDIGNEFLGYYSRLVGENSGPYEQAEKVYRRDLDKDSLEPHKARINRAIKRALGERRAAPYLICQLDRISASRRHRFGLSLPGETITIDAASLSSARVGAERAHTPSRKPKAVQKS